ncbi:glycosyltransferase family 61 protein [Tianweitania sp.]|uniref:glycosyltransferase family 61 protein n=1 Tax=Tianweitania sp. TaxID=2021634 RepID=UPI0028A2A67D|nr:glycosyltransferase family 61 protein [Tianweitania sp.]
MAKREHIARYVDSDYYLARYQDVKSDGGDPRLHFINFGLDEGRAPNRYFDPAEYSSRYKDVPTHQAMEHWIEFGTFENRIPCELFDAHWYRSEYLAGATEAEPLLHFLEQGEAQGFNPHPDFDSAFYLESLSKLNLYTDHPLHHYLRAGLDREVSPNPNFDVHWYITRYADVAAARCNPLFHFVQYGAVENRLPNPFADEQQVSTSLRGRDLKFSPHHRRILGPWESRQGAFVGNLYPLEPSRGRSPQRSVYGGKVINYRNVELVAGTRILIDPNIGILSDEWFDTALDVTITQKYRQTWSTDDQRIALGYKLKNNSVIRSGVHLMAEADYNYFHFVAEVLCRAINVVGMPEDLPALLSANLPASYYDAIDCLFQGRRAIEKLERGVLYAVENLDYVSDTARILDIYSRKAEAWEFTLDFEQLKTVKRTVENCLSLNADKSGGRKLYVRRRSGNRRILNEDEIIHSMIKSGFEVIQPEDFTFRDQVALFHNADLVVGATGAALTNLLWCRPSTRAVVLYSDSQHHQLNLWNLITKPAGFEVEIMFGPRSGRVEGMYSVHDDFRIDVPALVDRIG